MRQKRFELGDSGVLDAHFNHNTFADMGQKKHFFSVIYFLLSFKNLFFIIINLKRYYNNYLENEPKLQYSWNFTDATII